MSLHQRVSIIIPVFNQRLDFLCQAIESALAQTWTNFELVISDNHSEENVRNLLECYANAHSEIRLVRPETHLQMRDHFSFAVRSSRGEFISILCSDDLYLPNHISTLMGALGADEQLHCAFTRPQHGFDIGSALPFDSLPAGPINAKRFTISALSWSICSLGAMVFRRSLFDRIGGFECNTTYAFDVDFIFRCLQEVDFVGYDPMITTLIRMWDRDESRVRATVYLADLLAVYDRLESRQRTRALKNAIVLNKYRILYPQIAQALRAYLSSGVRCRSFEPLIDSCLEHCTDPIVRLSIYRRDHGLFYFIHYSLRLYLRIWRVWLKLRKITFMSLIGRPYV